MLDETCDITIKKKKNKKKTKKKNLSFINVSFLGNKHITDGIAEGIKTAVCDFLCEKGLLKIITSVN